MELTALKFVDHLLEDSYIVQRGTGRDYPHMVHDSIGAEDIFNIASGKMKRLQFDDGHFYPAQDAVDFYHHYKEDIALFAEMGFKGFRT